MRLAPILILLVPFAACVDSDGRSLSADASVESCMQCHNGSRHNNYEGPGMENPHPFEGADNLACTTCHGGRGEGEDRLSSHIPAPPEIGDRENWRTDREAYFNRLTLTGIDKYPDYVVDGRTYTALDYLQFINPGDLRITSQSRGCGLCHQAHSDTVSHSLLATEAGILSGATYAIGVDNHVDASRGLHLDTAADLSFRAIEASFVDLAATGSVEALIEFPVYSVRDSGAPDAIHKNAAYDSGNLDANVESDNSATTDSPLAKLYHEQVAFTCGDCHLGSAGANNRYGDFRSSGCSACHMPYSLDGRSRSNDPNVPRDEPIDPDDIDEPELSHLRAHRIVSVKKTLESGVEIEGIDDYACAGCHQGSNRTVMQYWGIRLDQNQNLRNKVQYPANPVTWKGTHNDARLFDPEVRNRTFNGRNGNQYILFEDYDGDGRDDTPEDVHYEAGLGCIDCHGSFDLHGGDVEGANPPKLMSRMEQSVAIRCESCHGAVSAYARTMQGTAYNGEAAELAVDGRGRALPHVVKEADGNYYLYSRLTGVRHFVPQTRDTTIDTERLHPFTQEPLYSAKASYAMGRDDGLAATGIGPQQGGEPTQFTHTDSMNCASCHAAWTNTCMGCHLEGEYNTGNNFSNITGQRIVFRERFADFVYQSPVFFQLGVNAHNEITQASSNTKMFFRWKDRNNVRSRVFAFTDRNGSGNNPGRGALGALGHNAMMAHSIRGKVSATQEGPRYCVACHLTEKGLEDYGEMYVKFREDMRLDRYEELNFDDLKLHFGQNPGNRLNSPLWVHMVAGLGSGLFLFDEQGRPVNPLDNDNDRRGTDRVPPATVFEPANAFFNLDRIVDRTGGVQASGNHPLLDRSRDLRDGAATPGLAGALGLRLVNRLTDPENGIILKGWLNADGVPQGVVPDPVK